MENEWQPSQSPITRRTLIRLAGLGAVGLIIAACDNSVGGGGSTGAPTTGSQGSTGSQGNPPTGDGLTDFSPRFAAYEAADEPNADPSKVVWPDFVPAGSEARTLYEFQLVNGDLMKYIPCFCGCFKEDQHRNNRDCYIKTVNADGSVVFDDMAPT